MQPIKHRLRKHLMTLQLHYPFEHTEMVQSDELQIGMKLIDGVWKIEELIEEDV